MGFNQILSQIRQLGISQSQRDKGTAFEILTKKFLFTDETYKAKFSDVWLRDEFELDGNYKDIGIDIIAKTYDDEFVAIQCKCYDEHKKIDKKDIDSFLSASGRTYKNKHFGIISFESRLLVYIAKDLSDNAFKMLENQDKPIFQITYQDFINSNIDWTTFDINKKDYKLENNPLKKLRKHQIEAIDNIQKEFETNNRTKLIMACGTGKSLTAVRLCDDVVEKGEIGIFFAPSISLVSQTMKVFFEQSEKELKGFVVCSDTKVGKDSEDIRQIDLPYPPTTNSTKLAEHINIALEQNNKVMIFSTYQSIDVTAEALEQLNKEAKIIICDEAHRTAGFTQQNKEESDFVKVHDNDFIGANKRLYMTATPKIYSETLKEKEDLFLYSMDDEKIFGREAYNLMFDKALEKDLLSDYKVIIAIIDEKQVVAMANDNTSLTYIGDDDKEYSINISTEFLGQIIAVYKSLNKQDISILDKDGKEIELDEDLDPMKRNIAFNSSIKNSKNRTYLFEKIINLYDKENYNCSLDHIDGSMNATIKGEKLTWLTESEQNEEEKLKVLSNARCLTEGIDISNLDSVIFYDARDSLVDIVQAVGRVMRKAVGKKYGYIILPVVMNKDNIQNYDSYISSSREFKSVWKVLKALRSHDPRLVSEANIVERINIAEIKPKDGNVDTSSDDDGTIENVGDSVIQGTLNLDLYELSKSVRNIIPEKLGDRLYWSSFAKNVADIVKTILARIDELLNSSPEVEKIFNDFVNTLHVNINSSIDIAEAKNMLAQHIITKPIFDAIYGENKFGTQNPVAISLQKVHDKIASYGLENETTDLNNFYDSIKDTASRAITDKEKQNMIKNLYDTFFANAFKETSEKLGIVYTPIEVVDFILHSVDFAISKYFKGRNLNSKNTNIIDPFTGTGTFITRLLQNKLVNSHLEHKFTNEIFANEITLLAYYIANLNIASTYNDITGEYKELNNICFTDTFAMTESNVLDDTNLNDETLMNENTKRLKRQKGYTLDVIVGNPPYSAGQKSQNDNNQNVEYKKLNTRIKNTYVANSNQTLVKNLYDSYVQAIRWSSDRLNPNGIIGFVSNGSFIDGNNMSGLRASLENEFSYIYIMNLRGNARTSGEQRRKEGGGVFDSGSRTPVAIFLLIKDETYTKDKATIYYHDIGDYLTREQKLSILESFKSIENVDFSLIKPNKYNDWVNQRDDSFDEFVEISNKNTKFKDGHDIFKVFSQGILTSRDAWCINFNKEELTKNISNTIKFYNIQRENKNKKYELNTNKNKISWSYNLLKSCENNIVLGFEKNDIRNMFYRPFCKTKIYYNSSWNERQYQTSKIYPLDGIKNLSIIVVGLGASKDFSCLISNCINEYHTMANGQCFPLYYYKKVKKTEQKTSLFAELEPKKESNLLDTLDEEYEYIKKDAIRDWALNKYQEVYQDKNITKEDIFYYIYGLLHSKEYKERFKDNLSKQLPRIPFAKDFWTFSKIGRELAYLHINYETIEPNKTAQAIKRGEKNDLLATGIKDLDDDKYLVNKIRFDKRSNEGKSRIFFNEYITIDNIPLKAYQYIVNGKSAIEWILDRYQIKTDKDSGITNDPNLYSKDKKYIFNLLMSIIEVGVRSVDLIEKLPKIDEIKN